MARKVRRGRRGQHHRATPDDLRDSDPGLSGPVRHRVALTCEVCGGPVPFDVPAQLGDTSECLRCGLAHFIGGEDEGCAVCQAIDRIHLN